MDETFAVVLEIGTRRVFASAIEWPGWSRSGRDEGAALVALAEYGSRYQRVVEGHGLGFRPPTTASRLHVAQRVPGNATTDYGAPGVAPEADERPLDRPGLDRQIAILRASWQALDLAASAAAGVTLRTGPRGGGRDLRKMIDHVFEAERAYVGQFGTPLPPRTQDSEALPEPWRAAVVEALEVVAAGGVSRVSPRGARRWSVRYFVRRAAWHVLDHAWEIEDRGS